MPLSKEPLLDADAIARRVNELAAQLDADYAGRTLDVVVILKGSFVFAADLVRRLTLPVRIDFVRIRSYRGTDSTGEVNFLSVPESDFAGRHVLLVEDIVDTGRTTRRCLDWMAGHAPASVALCTLLDKPGRRATPVAPDYTGFTLGDEYVVGYGLDLDEAYRNLPAIYVWESPSG